MNKDVIDAMSQVDRHHFVLPEMQREAYHDSALPIHFGQTISQPYIVALMTELLNPKPNDVMLEVGTGSGYQAAVLSKIIKHVYTIEIIPGLAKEAKERLESLDYANITVRQGDGYKGWPEHAPFDGIIVTAAAEHVPPPLLEQLKPGAKLVIPVGASRDFQELFLFEKMEDGSSTKKTIIPVRFVPLTREK